MKDGSQDFVNSLDLISCETNHFHGISHCSEISTIIYGGLLKRERGRERKRMRQRE